jgi:O-antigen/teichoic acid export membrane protein
MVRHHLNLALRKACKPPSRTSRKGFGFADSSDMKLSRLAVLKGIGWTVGVFGLSQLLRFVTIVAITRLLTPELFGIMAIVNSVRTGVDLASDLGIGQNIIQNKNADDPTFLNTAWTLQLIRGPILWIICSAVAVPLAHLYQSPLLIFVLPVAALYFVVLGFSSISMSLLQRRLQFARLNTFDLFSEFISALALLLFSYLSPTVWALVFGNLVGPVARMITSYFLVPDLQHRVCISKQYATQIFRFGKWIFVSSLVYFLSMNFDRLFLGKAAPLALLGVYGVARSLSDPIGALVARICNYVVFPVFASNSATARDSLRRQVASMRTKSLVLVALGLSLFVTVADLPVKMLYDQRYQAAGWMLPLMTIGLWFSIICSVNETTLLGFGKPHYSAIANGLKFSYLLIALPVGFMEFGVLGAVVAVAVGDVSRYGPILFGQIRERFSFRVQDFSLTLMFLALVVVWGWLRCVAGFGTSFDDLPITD